MNQADQEVINGIYKPLLEASTEELPPEAPKLVTDRVPQPNPQLIEPKKEDVVLCTYPDTLDGRLAAWVVRGVAQSQKFPVEFVVEKDGEPGPTAMPGQNHIIIAAGAFLASTEGKSALVFSRAASTLFEAPLPFRNWKRTFPFGIETMKKHEGKTPAVVGDGRKSLSAAAWDFFYADRVGFDKRPRLVDYVNDETKNAFNDTAAVVACLNTYPKDFQTMDKLAEACDDRKRLAFIVTSGQAVLRYIAQHRDEVDQD